MEVCYKNIFKIFITESTSGFSYTTRVTKQFRTRISNKDYLPLESDFHSTSAIKASKTRAFETGPVTPITATLTVKWK